jgi:tRNA/rRNA methyltransferase
MRLKIIIVDPKYQMNAGYIARVARNFGVKKLFFVKPRANLSGQKAIMFSKHGVDLLKHSTVYDGFDQATAGCDLVLGTTGRWRSRESVNEHEYTLTDSVKEIKKRYSKDAVIGLVIGRDDTGLNREEIEKCDMIVHIASNPDYPILNISHALAIMLYEFTRGQFAGYETLNPEKAKKAELEVLMKVFERMTSGKKIRNRTAVRNVFARMVRKAELNRNELHALITAFK